MSSSRHNPLIAKFKWNEVSTSIIIGRDFLHFYSILDYLMFDLERPAEVRDCSITLPTIKDNLLKSKRNLEERLSVVNAGLKALENNPALAEALETLTKAIRA